MFLFRLVTIPEAVAKARGIAEESEVLVLRCSSKVVKAGMRKEGPEPRAKYTSCSMALSKMKSMTRGEERSVLSHYAVLLEDVEAGRGHDGNSPVQSLMLKRKHLLRDIVLVNCDGCSIIKVESSRGR